MRLRWPRRLEVGSSRPRFPPLRPSNRFTGFGADRPVPEQIAAVQALAAIGGSGAAQAVARMLTRKVILGPGLKVAVGAAAQLKSSQKYLKFSDQAIWLSLSVG
jgi:hypothetical protein